MITRPVGEIFQDGKFTLKVVENNGSCNGCHYDANNCYCYMENVGYCSQSYRLDRKNVCFELQSTDSQNAQIRECLLSGKRINQMQALELFGCMRLGARIYDLKKTGMNINREIVKNNGKHYAEYFL